MSKDKVVESRVLKNENIDTNVPKKENMSGFGLAKGKKSFKRSETEHEDLL